MENAGRRRPCGPDCARCVFDYWLMGEYPNEEKTLPPYKRAASAPIGKPPKASKVRCWRHDQTLSCYKNNSCWRNIH